MGSVRRLLQNGIAPTPPWVVRESAPKVPLLISEPAGGGFNGDAPLFASLLCPFEKVLESGDTRECRAWDCLFARAGWWPLKGRDVALFISSFFVLVFLSLINAPH